MTGSWWHAACTECFRDRHAAHFPEYAVRLKEPARLDEGCCYCGIKTRSGLYDRNDPGATPCLGRNSPVHMREGATTP